MLENTEHVLSKRYLIKSGGEHTAPESKIRLFSLLWLYIPGRSGLCLGAKVIPIFHPACAEVQAGVWRVRRALVTSDTASTGKDTALSLCERAQSI